jgi:hypothetical protein
MQVPADFAVVGWYVHAPTPGELGPAVLAGHVDSRRGPAVFFRLATLRPADRVMVGREDGRTAVFTVDRVARYPKPRFPTAEVYGDLPYPGLHCRVRLAQPRGGVTAKRRRAGHACKASG